jgi:ACS family hexuronate transporter-like MFS transporter
MFKNYRSSIVFMLFMGGVINYLDRAALGIVAPIITKEFNLEATQMGIVFSIFSVGYAIFNFVGGYLSDRLGPYKVMLYAMIFWSLACGATALTVGFTSLLVVRALFGIGEGPIGSSMNKTINNWIPKKERARAISFSNCGQPLGGAIASPIIGFIALSYGWRVSFIAVVFIGLVWAFFWARMAKDYPHQHPGISKKELEEIEGDQDTIVINISQKKPLAYYLRQPVVLFTAFGLFAYNYVLFFFLTWFPSYLTMAKGLSIKEMSIATIIPWVIASVGQVVGGQITDYIYQKTNNAIFSRKFMIIGGMMCAAVMVVVTGVVESATSAVVTMSVAILFLYLSGSAYWAFMQDIAPRENVGGVSGFIHAIGNVSGIVAPIITGYIIQTTGSFTSAFILTGALSIIASITFGFFAKPVREEACEDVNFN